MSRPQRRPPSAEAPSRASREFESARPFTLPPACAMYRLGALQTDKDSRKAWFGRGVDSAERGIERDPDCAQAHYLRSVNLASWGRERGIMRSLFLVDDIRGGFARTLELEPGHPDATLGLGKIDEAIPGFAGGSKKRAEERFRSVIEAHPHFTRALLDLAELLAATDREDEAIDRAEEALMDDRPERPDEVRKFDRARGEALLHRLGVRIVQR